MKPRRYSYIGPDELKQRLKRESHCIHVTSAADLVPWMATFSSHGRESHVPATFIITLDEQLWIADRRSEHVACASGEDVLAAGEIVFARSGNSLRVEEATNQSTGYCPEPECWSVVARVLNRLGISQPPFFTQAFAFRRCDRCGATNLIKDEVYECAICNSPLSQVWNFSRT